MKSFNMRRSIMQQKLNRIMRSTEVVITEKKQVTIRADTENVTEHIF